MSPFRFKIGDFVCLKVDELKTKMQVEVLRTEQYECGTEHFYVCMCVRGLRDFGGIVVKESAVEAWAEDKADKGS